MALMRIARPVDEHDHRRGELYFPVQIVEYGDFQDPFCGLAFLEFEQWLAEFPDRLCFIYRHFPQSDRYPHAELAAMAAEAAAEQFRFWEMYRLLFENQEILSPRTVFACALALGLDLEIFQRDLHSDHLKLKVVSHRQEALLSGASTSPLIYFNGVRVDVPVSYIQLRGSIPSI